MSFDHAQPYGSKSSWEQEEYEYRWCGFFVLIPEGGKFPMGMGMAWRDYASLRGWCCPYPLNWLASWIRRGYWRARCGPNSEAERRRVHMAVDRCFELRDRYKDARIDDLVARAKRTGRPVELHYADGHIPTAHETMGIEE